MRKFQRNFKVDTTYLLWTGGWDSTFRLLQLIYVEGKAVQPVYIIDLSHRSPIYELISMRDIRNKLKKDEKVDNLLKPTIYIDRNEIDISNKILKAWKKIKQKRHIGKQYVWIASFCKKYDLYGIELSIQKRNNEERIADSLAYNLKASRITSEEKDLFGFFSFPLLHLTKKEMKTIAEQENWMDIMESTWFCHHPIYHPLKKGIPCGICNPCRIAVKEGFKHRIPLPLRFSGKYLKKLYNSSVTKNLLKNIRTLF